MSTQLAVAAACAIVVLLAQTVALTNYVILTRRGRRLAAVASAIAQGKFDTRLRLGRFDTATAARAFNSMADELEKRRNQSARITRALSDATAQAQALASVSLLLAGSKETVAGLSQLLADLSTEVLGDGAFLRTLNADGSLATTATQHRDPVQAVLLASAGTEPMTVAIEWKGRRLGPESIVVQDNAKDQFLQHLPQQSRRSYASMRLSSLLVMALPSGDETVGMLAVFRSDPLRPFTTGDVKFAREFAGLAGLAITNASLVAALKAEVAHRVRSERATRRAVRLKRELLIRLEDVARAKRRSIAGDLHDDAVQVMAAALMRIGLARVKATGEGAAQLDAVESLVSLSIHRLRSLIFQLAPPDLQDYGLERSLRRMAEDVFQDTEVRPEVTVTCAEVDASTSETIFRITREALVNVRKHAGATSVRVILSDDAGGIRGEILDDGVGVKRRSASAGHLGLTLMTERAEATGGWLRVTRRTRGTRVRFLVAHVPLAGVD